MQLPFDLVVRQPSGHEPEDLGLPRGQFRHSPRGNRVREAALHQGGDGRGCQEGMPGRDGAHRVDQGLRGRVLQQETGGPRTQGPENVLIQVEHGQHQHTDFGQTWVADDGTGRRDPIELRHADVHQHDIRHQLPGQ